RRLGRRETVRLAVVSAGEGLFTIGALVAAGFRVVRSPDAPTIVWAAAVVGFLAAAIAFAVGNRRGVFAPSSETVREFLAIAEERCERRLQAARFAVRLLVAELGFLVPWGVWEILHDPARSRAHAALT